MNTEAEVDVILIKYLLESLTEDKITKNCAKFGFSKLCMSVNPIIQCNYY